MIILDNCPLYLSAKSRITPAGKVKKNVSHSINNSKNTKTARSFINGDELYNMYWHTRIIKRKLCN